jgi:uncharacterized membrane protein YcaP (DUF421 family)
MNLRINNVAKLSDVEWATLEPNGQVGYKLKQEALPATSKQVNELREDIRKLSELFLLSQTERQKSSDENTQNMFTEVDRNSHHENAPPKRLQ